LKLVLNFNPSIIVASRKVRPETSSFIRSDKLDDSGNRIYDFGSYRPSGSMANWNLPATLPLDKSERMKDEVILHGVGETQIDATLQPRSYFTGYIRTKIKTLVTGFEGYTFAHSMQNYPVSSDSKTSNVITAGRTMPGFYPIYSILQ